MVNFLLTIYFLQMAIEAYDTAFPDMIARTEVIIDVVRNPSPPVFTNNFYTQTVNENIALGSFVLRVTANDNDGDDVSYEMVPPLDVNNLAYENFFVTTDGAIYVQDYLSLFAQDQYTFTVRARDHAFPEKFGTSSVQINVVRDRFTPVFSLQNYEITISETTAADSLQPILTVSATDNDLRVGTLIKLIQDNSTKLRNF